MICALKIKEHIGWNNALETPRYMAMIYLRISGATVKKYRFCKIVSLQWTLLVLIWYIVSNNIGMSITICLHFSLSIWAQVSLRLCFTPYISTLLTNHHIIYISHFLFSNKTNIFIKMMANTSFKLFLSRWFF